MNLIRKWLEFLEAFLTSKLRAWYWHFEVERLAFEHFYNDQRMSGEAKLKANLCALLAQAIHFFVEDEALLLEQPEGEQNGKE